MDTDYDPEPCLPIVSFLASKRSFLAKSCSLLDETYNNFRLFSSSFSFHETDYYEDEMGKDLFRWWGYRHHLANPSQLMEWKKECSNIEDKLRNKKGNRSVNIDPGYLNYGLVVLGSHKYFHQKIYLGKGVYADPVLQFLNGIFRPFPWSFPDFQDDRYYEIMRELRHRYSNLRNKN